MMQFYFWHKLLGHETKIVYDGRQLFLGRRMRRACLTCKKIWL